MTLCKTQGRRDKRAGVARLRPALPGGLCSHGSRPRGQKAPPARPTQSSPGPALLLVSLLPESPSCPVTAPHVRGAARHSVGQGAVQRGTPPPGRWRESPQRARGCADLEGLLPHAAGGAGVRGVPFQHRADDCRALLS